MYPLLLFSTSGSSPLTPFVQFFSLRFHGQRSGGFGPVALAKFLVKKMKTRWGTCNSKAKRIWINLELAKKPLHCLEFIVVHELTHLIERYHNDHFKVLMDGFMPQWRLCKKELNRFGLSHNG